MGDATRPWEQRADRGENDHRYGLFLEYLKLPKRGEANPRRYLKDLADKLDKREQNLSALAQSFEWEKRAEEYDRFSALEPLYQDEARALMERAAANRELAREVRQIATKMREQASLAIKAIEPTSLKPDDARKLINDSLKLEEQANRLEQPEREKRRERLKDDIRGLIGALAAQLGGAAGGGPGGAVIATERTVRLDLAGHGEGGGLGEVPQLPGDVLEGRFEPSADGGPGPDRPGDSPGA